MIRTEASAARLQDAIASYQESSARVLVTRRLDGAQVCLRFGNLGAAECFARLINAGPNGCAQVL
jgi:hypothetical protein